MNILEIGKVPNYVEIIRDILVSVDGPVLTEDLVSQILQRRTPNARKPHQAALPFYECFLH